MFYIVDLKYYVDAVINNSIRKIIVNNLKGKISAEWENRIPYFDF